VKSARVRSGNGHTSPALRRTKMMQDGLTNCSNCGEHFGTMEALWMHEASTHRPSERRVPDSARPFGVGTAWGGPSP
jgi:hypothetical protein